MSAYLMLFLPVAVQIFLLAKGRYNKNLKKYCFVGNELTFIYFRSVNRSTYE